jgi:transcriptional regulator with XRE-family HTH domain
VKQKMENNLKINLATSEQIESVLCEQLANIRLTSNLTQADLAQRAGVSLPTIKRMEKGAGISLNTFIRVLQALGLSGNLTTLLPDPTIRPMERVAARGTERKRSRPKRSPDLPATPWKWGDEKGNDK